MIKLYDKAGMEVHASSTFVCTRLVSWNGRLFMQEDGDFDKYMHDIAINPDSYHEVDATEVQ